MIAAAARTSGTRLPLASSLNRGVAASRNCRARTAARMRARRSRRARAADAEYVVDGAAGFLALDVVEDEGEDEGDDADERRGVAA